MWLPMSNPYEVLGVAFRAPPPTIKAAYLRLSREHHPDKGGDRARFEAVTEAARVLLNPRSRELADQAIRLSGKWPKNFCTRCKGVGEVVVGGEGRVCARCNGKGVEV